MAGHWHWRYHDEARDPGAAREERRSELWGIVTRDPAKAAPYGVRVFTDLDAALVAGGADAVYVASPVFLHAPQTLASLGAGKHVLCEKPMAMNYAEARSMVEAARAAGKTLGVAYYRRTIPQGGAGEGVATAGGDWATAARLHHLLGLAFGR